MDKMHVQQKKPEISICKKLAKKVRRKHIPQNIGSYTNTSLIRGIKAAIIVKFCIGWCQKYDRCDVPIA